MKSLKHTITTLWNTYGQTALNIYLFLSFGGWAAWQTYKTYHAGRLDFVEVSFALQNCIMVFLLLIRRHHKAVNLNLHEQAVAVVAFMSGAAFMGQPATGGPVAQQVSMWVIFASNVLGIATLLNLGRSFGILIAIRQVKTGGLYSLVRHPMYGTDILLRIGFLISHFNYFVLITFLASTACYIYRAMLEERFIASQAPEYSEYMKKVRYRFIPLVF